MSALDDRRTILTTATFPEYGQWYVNTTLESGDAPTVGDLVTLTIADITAIGTVATSGLDEPELPHVSVVGGIGWSAEVSRTALLTFQSAGGVRLSTVLNALAKFAGETIELPSDVTIGSHYACDASRAGQPALYRDALTDLVREGWIAGWHVGIDGVTRFVPRTETDLSPLVRATPFPGKAHVGLRVFGVDEPGQFMPGVSVEGVRVGRLVVCERPDDLRVECWQ